MSGENDGFKIVEIEARTKQTALDVSGIREDMRHVAAKLEKLIELQIETHHVGQAVERAFLEIKALRSEVERRFAETESETQLRVGKWEAWRASFEAERGKILAEIYATLNAWKGGVKVLWVLSGLIWAVIAFAGNYYIGQAQQDRARLETAIQLNTSRLRNAELYLAKNPEYKAAP